jgi:hypothetical protein
MRWTVIAVQVLPLRTIAVRFADGTEGKVRFEDTHLEGVFAKLKDPAFFDQAFLDAGAVAWPGDIDLAPDAMYSQIKRDGEWVLR